MAGPPFFFKLSLWPTFMWMWRVIVIVSVKEHYDQWLKNMIFKIQYKNTKKKSKYHSRSLHLYKCVLLYSILLQ